MNTYIKKFSEIGIGYLPQVGAKNSSLGEMLSKLRQKESWFLMDLPQLPTPLKTFWQQISKYGFDRSYKLMDRTILR